MQIKTLAKKKSTELSAVHLYRLRVAAVHHEQLHLCSLKRLSNRNEHVHEQ